MEDNQISFLYKLDGVWWSKGDLNINGQELEFILTGVRGNPLYDLLVGLLSIIPEFASVELSTSKKNNKYWIKWVGENWGYEWALEVLNDKDLKIRIEEFKDIDDPQTGQVKIDTICNLNHFIISIIRTFDTFIKSIGLLEYEHQWGDEFELTYFLKLKKYLIDKGLWQSSETECTLLQTELEILLK